VIPLSGEQNRLAGAQESCSCHGAATEPPRSPKEAAVVEVTVVVLEVPDGFLAAPLRVRGSACIRTPSASSRLFAHTHPQHAQGDWYLINCKAAY